MLRQPLGCSPAHQEHLLWKVIPSEQKLRLGSNFSVARVLPKNYFHFKHKLKCKCHGTDEFRANSAQLEGALPAAAPRRPSAVGTGTRPRRAAAGPKGCGDPRKPWK